MEKSIDNFKFKGKSKKKKELPPSLIILTMKLGKNFAPTVKKIVEKFVIELETQLGERDVIINLTDKASELICKLGFDKKMGARPLNRVIDDKIKKPLADELIHGKLINGGHVLVDAKEGQLTFEINKIEKTSKKTVSKTVQ